MRQFLGVILTLKIIPIANTVPNCRNLSQLDFHELPFVLSVQRMKTIHPDGVIRLAGYSYGASVAMEMTLQLQQQGECVQSLTLLDGSYTTVTAQVDWMSDRMSSVTTDRDIDIIAVFVLFAVRLVPSEVC